MDGPNRPFAPDMASVSAGAVSSPDSAPGARSASSYTDLPYLFGVQDPNLAVIKPKTPRRRATHGGDHVKHRRTRSGCFTCRQRRVKCDEMHPICERCRKGGRECLYPDKASNGKPSGEASKSTALASHPRDGSESDDSDAHHERSTLETIPDGDEEPLSAASNPPMTSPGSWRNTSQRPSPRSDSEPRSLDMGDSPTPSTESSTVASTAHGDSWLAEAWASNDGVKADWSHLPQDLQFYMTYFYDNITHLHYCMKTDPFNFLKTLYLEAATHCEPLLYAVVGFSAYQHLLQRKTGSIHDFLQYYNKAVSLLLRKLKSGARHSVSTLLTILQLATIEEFLGDWVNLFGHQKAAHEIMIELYEPDTVMQTPFSRYVLHWYTRFDLVVGILGGFPTILGREWSAQALNFYREQAVQEPGNLVWKIDALFADIRLIARDMSNNFTQYSKGQLKQEQFLVENESIGRRMQEWEDNLDPALRDERYVATGFTGCPAPDPDSIVDPHKPGVLHTGPLWAVNLAEVDLRGIKVMHRFQTANITHQSQSPISVPEAYEICQRIEAIELWPESPPGTILSLQSCLSLTALFLPRDDQHAMWVRRKLAKIETIGYIFPHTYRKNFAELFRDPSCMRWWLPGDEGYSPIMRGIRDFVDERTSPPKDVSSEDLRDMKTVFSSLKLTDGET